ncbi:sigma-54 dependent transcriptional regulator [Desulfovibrio sp. OttesenSCG-928-C14]|nr:sigma-54 dependent transcriptional regulator [Desulfovibrio sp. OttesenSCG-928-C14]
MNRPEIKLLAVDDDIGHLNTLDTLLSDWGYSTSLAASGEKAIELCRARPFDLVLMDMRMPGLSGLETLKEIKKYNPAIPVLIMTAYSDVGNAVEAIKAGAYDYLSKPLNFDELKLALERAVDHAGLRIENRKLRDALADHFDDCGIIGVSPAIQELMRTLKTVSPSEATVLLTGESGTGKELVAKIIHNNSPRRRGPYIAVNCAALSEPLLESELFGHEKGAFTGAERRRDGRFYAAHKGTIFLDEIGDIPITMQAKLLRVIQERELQRLGGDHPVQVDVRIIAATNRDLRLGVSDGAFREDLFYRLNVVTLEIPPLRERQEDIPLLARYFLKTFTQKNGKQIKGFTPAAMDKLLKYPWPGNVRELENTVERAVVLLLGDYVTEHELPPNIMQNASNDKSFNTDFGDLTLDQIEKIIVRQTLANAGGNKSEAARRLGITRKTLASKIQ